MITENDDFIPFMIANIFVLSSLRVATAVEVKGRVRVKVKGRVKAVLNPVLPTLFRLACLLIVLPSLAPPQFHREL